MKKWERFTPKLFSIIQNGYSWSLFKQDLMAGITVAIVALPLAMALGIACGVSPEIGLITAIIGGFLVSFFGGSRVQIGGPTGAFVVVVYEVIQKFGFDGLLIAMLLAGIILIIAGYLKLGMIVKYIPKPVVSGFTAGIAVIIASTQIGNFLGLDVHNVPAGFLSQWKYYFSIMGSLNMFAVFVGMGALFIILLFKKLFPKVPGVIIALIVFSFVVYFLHLPVKTIGSQYANMGTSFKISFPSLTFDKIHQVMPIAFVIAFLGGMEALLSAVVADGMTGYKHRPNQELVAQGIANLGSFMFGGIPVTGAIARTATNIAAGGKTPVAGIVHSILIFLFVVFLTPLIRFVPIPTLAAVLFLVAWRMGEFPSFFQMFTISKQDGFLMLLTFFLTIFFDLTLAIGVGMILASLLFMWKMSQSVEIFSWNKEGMEHEYNHRDSLPEGVEAFWISGPIFFGITHEIVNLFQGIGPLPKVLIIRMRLVPYLDISGVSALEDLVKQCEIKKIKIVFSALQAQPKVILKKLLRKKGVYSACHFEQALEDSKNLLKE